MSKKIFKSVENRHHKRIEFEVKNRPILQIGNYTFEVENVSKGGVKFLTEGKGNIELDKEISGVLRFPSGESVEVEGSVIWQTDKSKGMSFYDLLPDTLADPRQQTAFLTTKIAIPTLSQIDESEQEGYTVQSLTKLGIEPKRLKDWMTFGYIEPSVPQADIPGSKPLFSHFDLYMVKLFEHLIDNGFPEEESSVRIKILALANKKSERFLDGKNHIGFSRKTEFSSLPEDMRQNIISWILQGESIGDAEKREAKKILKDFIPAIIEEKGKTLLLSSQIYEGCDSILIVNFKKIRNHVDMAMV
jgi:hypothetical protein